MPRSQILDKIGNKLGSLKIIRRLSRQDCGGMAVYARLETNGIETGSIHSG